MLMSIQVWCPFNRPNLPGWRERVLQYMDALISTLDGILGVLFCPDKLQTGSVSNVHVSGIGVCGSMNKCISENKD